MGALDEIFGAALTGVIVNAWVLGLVCVLSYQYYVNFPRDGMGTKLLVAWMWALQTFNGLVVSKMIYYYLISSFGVLEHLGLSIWEWSLYLGLSSIAAFSVQTYYARRIFVLSKSYVLYGVILLFAFCQLGFGLATMSEAFVIVVFEKFIPVTWVCVTWLSFSAACDLIIAATQVVYLHRHRTGITGTNRIINILILYIMSTGLLTSIVAILELTTFATLGFNFVHVFLSFPMGAIYTVSFLANLDARRTVRPIGAQEVSNGVTVPDHLSIEFRRVKHVHTDPSDFQGDSTKFTESNGSDMKFKNDGQTPFV
ncbi:hypothetical protein Hypma_001126 [Hypsizygus marmoreus]|uniref:DUF6534 domain-containing protein n=1 Tax=Hypsizygus marmoreus TaxID=39966 RepID=A0A369J8R9_HYPMA|nr:hypothetical protein Hypma_001126 [Hypsizygus marmoreus]